MSNSTVKRVSGAALLVCLLAGGSAGAEEQDFIDYRQHAMRTLKEEMSLIGMILEKKAPSTEFAAHARMLSLAASTMKMAFETPADGGSSKPEVWTQWQDFSKRLESLSAATQEIEKAAKAGDLAAAAEKMKTLGCKGCHDTYRVPDK